MTIVKTTKLVQASLTQIYNVTYESMNAAETDEVSVQIFMTKLEGLHTQISLWWIKLYWIHCQKIKVMILTNNEYKNVANYGDILDITWQQVSVI